MRAWRLGLLGLVVALLAGCQLEVQVGVDVEPDGNGEVTVAAALDEAAAARVPQLADQLEVDDLVETGWTVTGPALEADGRTWVRASKPFATPEEAGSVLDEVSGAEGPFRDFQVRRTPTLVRDEWAFTGTVDLSAGLGAFSDEALRERLDGTNVGRSDEEVAAAVGGTLQEAFTFQVAVVLPGDVSSNAPRADGGAVWRPVLGERLALAATGSRVNTGAALWLVVALTAALALLVLLAVRLRRRRRAGKSTSVAS